MIRVILAGEGRNELGGFATEAPFRKDDPEAGVIEALLRQVRPDGWRVIDAIPWKKAPKLQVGIAGKGEALNVQRAYHHAKKRGCDILAFTRDRDDAKFAHRESDIERAIASITETNEGPALVGGVAIEKIESWVAAIAGATQSEKLRRPEEKLNALGIHNKDTAGMVRVVEEHGLSSIPDDAQSLRRWLERAEKALNRQAA